MTRARVAPAYRTLPGHYPVDLRYPWATVAGCSLFCGLCGQESRTGVLPRELGYSEAVESWAAQHKHPEAA